uniref:Uncharacterized protein n=1 Tax=Pyramimonas obovata TaxID=1411642 RepID=A0A7S0QZD8_9CHLO
MDQGTMRSPEAQAQAFKEWQAAKAAERSARTEQLRAARRDWASKEAQGLRHKMMTDVQQKRREEGWTGVLQKDHTVAEPTWRVGSRPASGHQLAPPKGGTVEIIRGEDIDAKLALTAVTQAAAEERRLRERLQQLQQQQEQQLRAQAFRMPV